MEMISFHPTPVLNNQCIVCGTDSLSNYVDLTLITSRTSHSETPVKDKLRGILCDKWISTETELSFIMCLACFQLVDQFDALEAQLKAIRDNLCDKYINSHGRIHSTILEQEKFITIECINPVHTSTSNRGKRVKTTPKRKSSGRRKRSVDNSNIQLEQSQPQQIDVSKKSETSDNMLHWQQTAMFDAEMQQLPEIPGPSHQLSAVVGDQLVSAGNSLSGTVWSNTENGTSIKQTVGHISDELDEEESPASKTVYDDDMVLLNRGEKFRVGVVTAGDSTMMVSYTCCYCTELSTDTESLKNHVRSRHRPEVLTTQIPLELGLGSQVNCGVQINNVSAVSELGKPFVCLFCDGAFKFKSNIHLHYKEKHTPYKPFKCMDCQESFRRSMELSRHRVYYCPHRKKARSGNEKKVK